MCGESPYGEVCRQAVLRLIQVLVKLGYLCFRLFSAEQSRLKVELRTRNGTHAEQERIFKQELTDMGQSIPEFMSSCWARIVRIGG